MTSTMSAPAAASILGIEVCDLDVLRVAGRIRATTDEHGRVAYTVEAIHRYLRALATGAQK